MTSGWNGIRRTMLGAKQSRLLFAAALFATILAGAQAFAQEPQGGPDERDNQKVKPFKIIGNVYFVGMTDQTVLLIATPEGHILIDTHWERMVPWIRESVEALGFNIRDIKHILNSHSHADHVEGHSMVKELTGAQVVFSEADGAVMAEGGGIGRDGRPLWKPVRPDRLVRTGDTVTLGGTTLTAHVFPGHTRGATTWTMVAEEDGRRYNVVLWGGLTVQGPFVNNANWPTLAEEYADSLRRAKLLPCDIYTEPHGQSFALSQKMQRLLTGARPNPFFDPVACQESILRRERIFKEQLAKERVEAAAR